MINTKERNLIVLKEEYFDTMGKLSASLKSAKKSYMAYRNPNIVSRAVINKILIPAEELITLGKPKEPHYWTQLKKIESEKDYIMGLDMAEGQDMYAIGFMAGHGEDKDKNIESVLSEYGLSVPEVNIQNQPNGYCTITRKV